MYLLFEVYDPHPHICKMAQYKCCKNHQSCPLYQKCRQTERNDNHIAICKMDCPTCTYEGCSLSADKRNSEPLYVKKEVQSEMLDLNLETIRTKEQLLHYKQHEKMLYFYKTLFGHELERRAKYRKSNREFINQTQNEKRRQKKIANDSFFDDSADLSFTDSEKGYLPCGGDCFSCEYDDCILSEDDVKKCKTKAYNRNYYLLHKKEIIENQRAYRNRCVQLDSQYYSKEYAKYREIHLQKSKKYYEEHKKEWQEYSKKYRAEHKEELRQKKLAYREAHREELREKAKAYYRNKKMMVHIPHT